eukprot:scaffold158_cov105-Cylindrotheca_fusiformis.AAC.12
MSAWFLTHSLRHSLLSLSLLCLFNRGCVLVVLQEQQPNLSSFALRASLCDHLLKPIYQDTTDDVSANAIIRACASFLGKESPQLYLETLQKEEQQQQQGFQRENNNKRSSSSSSSSFPARIASPAYPILTQVGMYLLQHKLWNAAELVRELDAAPNIDDIAKDEGWLTIFQYLFNTGQLFLDRNYSTTKAYSDKRDVLYNTVASQMSELGRLAMIHFYLTVDETVSSSLSATWEEKQYVQVACQQTLLRLLFKTCGLGPATVAYFLRKTSHKWTNLIASGDLEEWAATFLQRIVDIPSSLQDDDEDPPDGTVQLRRFMPTSQTEEETETEMEQTPTITMDSTEVIPPDGGNATVQVADDASALEGEENVESSHQDLADNPPSIADDNQDSDDNNDEMDVDDVEVVELVESPSASEEEQEALSAKDESSASDVIEVQDSDDDGSEEEQGEESGEEEQQEQPEEVAYEEEISDNSVDRALSYFYHNSADYNDDDDASKRSDENGQEVHAARESDENDIEPPGENLSIEATKGDPSSENDDSFDDIDGDTKEAEDHDGSRQVIDSSEPEPSMEADRRSEAAATMATLSTPRTPSKDMKGNAQDPDQQVEEAMSTDDNKASEGNDSDATEDMEKREGETSMIDDTTDEESAGKSNRAATENLQADSLDANAGYGSQLEEGYEPEDTHGYTEEEVSEAIHTEDEEEDRRKKEAASREVVEEASPNKFEELKPVEHAATHSSDDMDAADEHTEQEEDLGAEFSELEETPQAIRKANSTSPPSSPVQEGRGNTTLWQFAQTAQRQHDTLVSQDIDDEKTKSVGFEKGTKMGKNAVTEGPTPDDDTDGLGAEAGTESNTAETSENFETDGSESRTMDEDATPIATAQHFSSGGDSQNAKKDIGQNEIASGEQGSAIASESVVDTPRPEDEMINAAEKMDEDTKMNEDVSDKVVDEAVDASRPVDEMMIEAVDASRPVDEMMIEEPGNKDEDVEMGEEVHESASSNQVPPSASDMAVDTARPANEMIAVSGTEDKDMEMGEAAIVQIARGGQVPAGAAGEDADAAVHENDVTEAAEKDDTGMEMGEEVVVIKKSATGDHVLTPELDKMVDAIIRRASNATIQVDANALEDEEENEEDVEKTRQQRVIRAIARLGGFLNPYANALLEHPEVAAALAREGISGDEMNSPSQSTRSKTKDDFEFDRDSIASILSWATRSPHTSPSKTVREETDEAEKTPRMKQRKTKILEVEGGLETPLHASSTSARGDRTTNKETDDNSVGSADSQSARRSTRAASSKSTRGGRRSKQETDDGSVASEGSQSTRRSTRSTRSTRSQKKGELVETPIAASSKSTRGGRRSKQETDDGSVGSEGSQSTRRSTRSTRSTRSQKKGELVETPIAASSKSTRGGRRSKQETDDGSVASEGSQSTRRSTRSTRSTRSQTVATTRKPEADDESVLSEASQSTRRSTRSTRSTRSKTAATSGGRKTEPEADDASVLSEASQSTRRSTRSTRSTRSRTATTNKGGRKTKEETDDDESIASEASQSTRRSTRSTRSQSKRGTNAMDDDQSVASAAAGRASTRSTRTTRGKQQQGDDADDNVSVGSNASRPKRTSARAKKTGKKSTTSKADDDDDDESIQSSASRASRRSARAAKSSSSKTAAKTSGTTSRPPKKEGKPPLAPVRASKRIRQKRG